MARPALSAESWMVRRESAEVCCSGAEELSQLPALKMHCWQLLVAVLLHEAARGSQSEVGVVRQQTLPEPLVTHDPEHDKCQLSQWKAS